MPDQTDHDLFQPGLLIKRPPSHPTTGDHPASGTPDGPEIEQSPPGYPSSPAKHESIRFPAKQALNQDHLLQERGGACTFVSEKLQSEKQG